MAGIFAFIIEVFYVLGIPLLAFGVFYLIWRGIGKSSKQGWVRKSTGTLLGLSFIALAGIAVFVFAIALAPMCPTGNCRKSSNTEQQKQCANLLISTIPDVYANPRSDPVRLHSIWDEFEKWEVLLDVRPQHDVVIPRGMKLDRDEYMSSVKVLYSHCYYDFKCIANKYKNDRWEYTISSVSIGDGNDIRFNKYGFDYCKK